MSATNQDSNNIHTLPSLFLPPIYHEFRTKKESEEYQPATSIFDLDFLTLEPSLVGVVNVNFQVVEKGGEDGREKVR